MLYPLLQLWTDDHGQDIAEYAVMLAVILVIVVFSKSDSTGPLPPVASRPVRCEAFLSSDPRPR